MLNIVLFGPPGAGKGTQSQKLLDHYGLVHLSTGDIFRSEIKGGTELGQKAKALIDKGELVPDEITVGMVEKKVGENADAKGFIFDGFPRTIAQAEALDKLLTKQGTEISGMVALEVPEEELVKRIKERGEISGRSDDQDDATVRNRIDVYNKETAPLADYYRKQSKYQSVNGVGSIEEIFGRLCQAVDSLQPPQTK